AVRPADDNRYAAESADTARRVAGFPGDLFVVELNVEVARARVRALDQHNLESVELVGMQREVSDVDEIRRESLVAVDGVASVRHQLRVRIAGVDIGEKRRDDLARRAGESERGVGRERVVERHVAVVVHIERRTLLAEEVDGEADRLERTR